MQHLARQIARAAAIVSMSTVLAAPMAALAQDSPMQGAASSSMAAPARTPQGARGEDPHYPSKESLNQRSGKSKHHGSSKPAAPGAASGGEAGN